MVKSKFYHNKIEADAGVFKGYTATMVNLGMCDFKYLNRGNIKTEELFTKYYAKEIHES